MSMKLSSKLRPLRAFADHSQYHSASNVVLLSYHVTNGGAFVKKNSFHSYQQDQARAAANNPPDPL
eukprot:162369-Pelagomonas_calceolata.AAC.12